MKADAIARASLPLPPSAHQIVEAREAERRTLARDLHDGLGQSLVVLQMNLRAARACVASDDPAAALIDSSLTMLGGLHRDIRGRALVLHSSVLDHLGLVPALRAHTSKLAAATGTRLEFDSQSADSVRWPTPIETAAFRIAQEAITNALRHACAARIVVHAAVDERALELRVSDDGVGFDCSAARAAAGCSSLGLVSMGERARLAGGRLTIASEAGNGTMVRVRFQRRRVVPSNRLQ